VIGDVSPPPDIILIANSFASIPESAVEFHCSMQTAGTTLGAFPSGNCHQSYLMMDGFVEPILRVSHLNSMIALMHHHFGLSSGDKQQLLQSLNVDICHLRHDSVYGAIEHLPVISLKNLQWMEA